MNIKKHNTLVGLLFLGYGFLYLPIASLILFSFNKNNSMTNWGGFSIKWYKKLFNNSIIIDAAWLSVKIALITAFISVIIGTIAAIIMVKFQKFKGKLFFNYIITAPLLIPDMIVGLSLLMFFVSTYHLFGWPAQRGMNTIIMGHATIAIAYVVLVLRTRLLEVDSALEEAALDLGARPIKVFFRITLPLVRPAIATGGLLAFTLSFDDVILSSFLSAAGSTTLPVVIFSSVKKGVSLEINALATIFITIVAISVTMSALLIQRYKVNKGN